MSALAALNRALGAPAIELPNETMSFDTKKETHAGPNLHRKPSLNARTISFRLGHKRSRSEYAAKMGPEIIITDPEGNDVTNSDAASSAYHALLNQMEQLDATRSKKSSLSVSRLDVSVERMPK